MVGVGGKEDTTRVAEAEGRIVIGREAFLLVEDNSMKKGDVLTVAQLAGIMGAKATSSLIPLCHPLLLTNIHLKLGLDRAAWAVTVTAR
jgi:molybdenum cofactor biosynthesis protein MoaC